MCVSRARAQCTGRPLLPFSAHVHRPCVGGCMGVCMGVGVGVGVKKRVGVRANGCGCGWVHMQACVRCNAHTQAHACTPSRHLRGVRAAPDVRPSAKHGKGTQQGGSQTAAQGTPSRGSRACSAHRSWTPTVPRAPLPFPATAGARASAVLTAPHLALPAAAAPPSPCTALSLPTSTTTTARACHMYSTPLPPPSGRGGVAAAHSCARSCRATHVGATAQAACPLPMAAPSGRAASSSCPSPSGVRAGVAGVLAGRLRGRHAGMGGLRPCGWGHHSTRLPSLLPVSTPGCSAPGALPGTGAWEEEVEEEAAAVQQQVMAACLCAHTPRVLCAATCRSGRAGCGAGRRVWTARTWGGLWE